MFSCNVYLLQMERLLMKQRQEKILQILSENGSMSVQALASIFNVSRMTIYRDINVLLKNHYIKKVPGGIAKRNYKQVDPGWKAKAPLQKPAKLRISQFLSQYYIQNDQMIFIESGSTATTLIPFLSRFERLIVYTNCLAAFYLLDAQQMSKIEIHITPGVLDYRMQAVIGEEALSFIDQLQFDCCFLSATGISLTGKLQDPNWDIIKIKQKVMEKSDKVFFLLDHSKFGKQSKFAGYSLDNIDYIVSDRSVPAPFDGLFLDHNVTILNAKHSLDLH